MINIDISLCSNRAQRLLYKNTIGTIENVSSLRLVFDFSCTIVACGTSSPSEASPLPFCATPLTGFHRKCQKSFHQDITVEGPSQKIAHEHSVVQIPSHDKKHESTPCNKCCRVHIILEVVTEIQNRNTTSTDSDASPHELEETIKSPHSHYAMELSSKPTLQKITAYLQQPTRI